MVCGRCLLFGNKATQPCPCGYFNHPDKECTCPPGAVPRYLNRISGPLLDRIDLHVEVVPVAYAQLSAGNAGESSQRIRQRVMAAREMQRRRYEGQTPGAIHSNAQVTGRLLRHYCRVDPKGEQLLREAMEKLKLSARAYDHILKISRTIADLSASEGIHSDHLAEAIQFRSLDRAGWAA